MQTKHFDLVEVLNQTMWRKDQVKLSEKIVYDPDKKARLAKQECVVCFYYPRVGGAMISFSNCGLCGKEMRFPSTNVDKLCPECAKEHRLCKHCGADIHLKSRRKL